MATAGAVNPWIQLGQFLRGSLPVMERVSRDERPLVPFKLGALQGYLVNHPDIVQEGLESEQWPPLDRGRMDNIKHWYEGGLATKTGSLHHRLRDQMWIPNVAHPEILERGIEEATSWTRQWTDGGTIEAYEDLRRLAYGIGWRLPTPEGLRGRRLRRELDAAIDGLAAERRNGFRGQDLLRDWVRSSDEFGASPADLRGSLKAFFGAENLHTHLAWTFYLLAQNPDAEARLHGELDRVLGGRPPTIEDLEALEYTRRVVTESLRIYPSV